MFLARIQQSLAFDGIVRLVGVAAIVALFGVGMCGFLGYFRFKSAVEAAAGSRMAVPATSVRAGAEASLSLGVPLGDETRALLLRERAADREIVEIAVLDTTGHTLLSTEPEHAALAGGTDEVRLPMRNSFDQPLGDVVVRYVAASSRDALARMRERLALIVAIGWIATTLLAGAGIRRAARRSPQGSGRLANAGMPLSQRLQSRLVASILAAVMLGMLGVTWATQRSFQDLLRPELQRKAGVVGGSVGELVSKALDHGLALPELVGVPAHLDAVRRAHGELAWLALRDDTGAVLFSSGRDEGTRSVAVPVLRQGRQVGAVEAQVSDAWIRHILLEAALDLGVVFVVTIFLTRELLHTFVSAGAAGAAPPADGAPVLARLRLPLFLFMLAEESTRAFLPGFARSLVPTATPVSPEFLAALPIVVFMVVVALGQPALATWSERAGPRRMLLRGALLGAVGLAGAAQASGVAEFIAWRGLCGLGYGMVFVAGQGLVLQHTDTTGRTRGFALFVGAIMAAAVCGPPIGGMLAEHMGPRAGFALAAAIAAGAWLAARGVPRDAASRPDDALAAPALRDYARVFAQGRFLWVAALAAFPAKLILAGSVFYLVPIHAAAEGASPAVAGRAMMLYAVALVLVLPRATHWVERGVPLGHLVGLGLCLSALGGFALVLGDGAMPIYLVTALLGLGQGLSIAAQSSLLAQVCAPEITAHGSGPAFGAYRLLERLGSASGPILAGALALRMGTASAFVAMAGLILGCGLCFLLLGRRIAR